MFLKFLLRRLLYVIPMLFFTTFLVFSLILLIPGDPVLAMLGDSATHEKVIELRSQLGLDQPVILQYFHWLNHAIHGDLGRSIFTGQLVDEAIMHTLFVTIQLVVVGMIFAIAGGMFFAITSIYFPNSWMDYVARFFGTLGTAIPNFLVAMVLIILFSLTLNWFPAIGFTSITDGPGLFLKSIILPGFSMSLAGIAIITRHLRSSLMETMDAEFVRTAYSKGATRYRAIFKHALQNAMVPVITTIGLMFGNALGATVVVESIFAIPGMGQLAVNAIEQRDFTMVQGVVLVMIVMVIVINFITDIVYALLDPRIEY
ncbi:ABC transporter permease [Neobacillus sp. MM2021_6]|uniref:ABC transporter permease n=1 Tax=Bacillaceae TaxID=186817 RepID=UPI00140C587E|nr:MULTISPECIES: ABC transporter permease [Bacillaceae]MBO0960052.1 ABC transporter permease [Neobacillus sp. MM2021_6]NHC21267.1 ABC transporter permease [Bacillus sp. MM2020_4]WML39594.1 ABC transporter permease [Neobacillus sp. OS1-2]